MPAIIIFLLFCYAAAVCAAGYAAYKLIDARLEVSRLRRQVIDLEIENEDRDEEDRSIAACLRRAAADLDPDDGPDGD